MQPLGLGRQAKARRALHGGFLAWAAKPKVRRSPNPANCLLNRRRHLCAGLSTPTTTTFSCAKFQTFRRFLLMCFGRISFRSV